MKKLIGAAACAMLALAACATVKKADERAFDEAALFGMIYDEDNQPCGDAQLTVDGKPGPQTDIRGRFVLPGLSRGAHSLVVTKRGCEPLSVSVSFLNRTDVLHLRVVSLPQLLASAERALAENRWGDGEALLQRARKLDPEDPVMRFLFAILARKTGHSAEAVEHLIAILASGERHPSVYRFLADIYENDLHDPRKALAALECSLEISGDSELDQRAGELRRRIDGATEVSGKQ